MLRWNENMPGIETEPEEMMRSYVIDELADSTIRHLEERLTDMNGASSMEKLFWLPIDQDLLTPIQREHLPECGPYKMAIELRDESVRLELLARAEGKLRCECICYLPPEAERKMMNKLDALIDAIQQDELSMLFGVCC